MKPLLEIRDVSTLIIHLPEKNTALLPHLTFDLMPENFWRLSICPAVEKSTLLNLIWWTFKCRRRHYTDE